MFLLRELALSVLAGATVIVVLVGFLFVPLPLYLLFLVVVLLFVIFMRLGRVAKR